MIYHQYLGVVKQKSKLLLLTVAALFGLSVVVGMFGAADAKPNKDKTTVPGHSTERFDKDDNGIPDDGKYVNGHYTSLYAYDSNGEYYWDLGDGRIQASVVSVDELEQDTLTTCDYVVNYRADFGNDPFMDDGWIQNHINCYGYDDNGHYNYLIVSDEDPRYTGNEDWSIWNTWEYKVLTQSGEGNLVKVGPQNHVN